MILSMVLDLGDYAIIALLIVVLAGGGAAASKYLRPADQSRLERIEQKLDLILSQLGIQYVPPPKTRWQELASDPAQKIAAIKAYREQNGGGLAEAKTAVEAYIDGRSA